MGFSLAPTASAAGYRLEAHDRIGSTNVTALENAQSGDPGNLWVVSKRQESGRGRRGRNWTSPEGNLAATILLVGDFELKRAATLGFVAGLALADALDAVFPDPRPSPDAGGARFELKWPNDVLFGGAKLSGILLESSLLSVNRIALAVGIGVNVVAHPEDSPYRSTSLQSLGFRGDAETLFLALSDSWDENIRVWSGSGGLPEIRRRWLARAAGLGSEVAVKVEGDIVRGVFETIDEDCHFVIRTNDELVKIAAGDVHFGAVASAGAI